MTKYKTCMGFCKVKKCLILFLNVSIFSNSCIIQCSLLVLCEEKQAIWSYLKSMILVSVFVLCEENQNLIMYGLVCYSNIIVYLHKLDF